MKIFKLFYLLSVISIGSIHSYDIALRGNFGVRYTIGDR